MPSYCLLQETITEDESPTRTVYGLVTPSGTRIPDILEDRSLVEAFINELNRGQADEIHIFDLVDDLINEAAMLP